MRASALPALLTALLAATLSHAEKSKFYYMDSLCKDHFLQRQYRKLDGGVLWSRNERNLDCTVTFQTHSILQRFMLHFDLLQLDCNDHLYVYDGAHATTPPKADLSCRNTKQQVGALFTRSNFVTLKYVTDNWGTDANGFKLVITAVKDPKHGCKAFRCKQREFCVSADLMCDGVDHCADGSDEDTATLCPGHSTEEEKERTPSLKAGIVFVILLVLQVSMGDGDHLPSESGGAGVGSTWVLAGAGGALLLALLAAVLCCYCRRRAVAQRTHLQI